MQTELRIMGSATRPKKAHSAAELAVCKTKAHACRLALLHSGLTQETVAERLAVTGGYLSMLLSGKRKWQDDLQHRFMNITGSLAPLQWDANREGVEVYLDAKKIREAELEAELAELRRAA